MALSHFHPSKLFICTLLHSQRLAQSLEYFLKGESSEDGIGDRYTLKQFNRQDDFLQFVEHSNPPVDCLILENGLSLPQVLSPLVQRSILIPAILLESGERESNPEALSILEDAPNLSVAHPPYHDATLSISITRLHEITQHIDEAIAKFLTLSAEGQLLNHEMSPNVLAALTVHSSLMQQHQRLNEKLKERLGYLGVYYKRNPAHFLRYMTNRERQEFLDQLKKEYSQIILSYFLTGVDLNEKIDNFVNLAFFADVPVAQIVEIHMELMDEFSNQLKLEGRSDEILLDYRLTLIDTIAHLCEMYRRSIPRES